MDLIHALDQCSGVTCKATKNLETML
ncbi:MAG: hypothetical protein RIT33_732, partial [Pseudomonadota bacterium]